MRARIIGLMRLWILGLFLFTGCSSDPQETESTRADSVQTSAAGIGFLSDSTAHHGIDVSYHSGTVDWTVVSEQGFKFAFVKATEGDDLKDPAFPQHWQELKALGLVRGAYHFYVTEDDPDTQAALFTSVVTLEQGDFAPVVDIELIGHNTAPGLVERFQRFLTRLEEHYDTKPIIYTTARFWDEHFTGEFGEYPLWVAEYEVDAPAVPNGWETWHLWQWQGDTVIAGVEKGADISRVNSREIDLSKLVVACCPK